MNPLRISGQVNQLKRMMQAFSSPQAFLDANPKFKAEFEKFKAENEGKSVEQIARDYGIDPAILKLL